MLKNLLCLAVALSVLCSFAQPLAAARTGGGDAVSEG